MKFEDDDYEGVLRELACELGAGGYNAEYLTTQQLYDKIQWGIQDHIRILKLLERKNEEKMDILRL